MDSNTGFDAAWDIADKGEWSYTPATRYSTGAQSDSGVITAGEIYRTLSSGDSAEIGTPQNPDMTHTGLQFQLGTIRPSKQFASSVSKMISDMASTVSQYLDSQATVVPYGSIASNLCVDGSTVDAMMFIPPQVFTSLFGSGGSINHYSDIPIGMVKEFEVRQAMRRALQRLSELLTVFCGLYMVKLTTVVPISSITVSSRVPVLTMIDPVSRLTFEITCNNIFPMFSTRLLKAYNSLTPTGELRDFILLVKHWARQRGLLGSSPGSLTGFSWTLLCIFYCQSCLGLLPSLQAISDERSQWTDPFGSNRRCDVGFEENYIMSVPLMGIDGPSLFVGFLDYWANYWTWSNQVISIRLGRVVNLESPEVFIRQLGDRPAERCSLVIEDPFDIKKDLCQNSGSLDRVREALMDASQRVSMGSPASSLFAASKSDSSPNRLFYKRTESFV